MMPLTRTRPKRSGYLTGLLLALLGVLWGSLPARADLYGAEQNYQAGAFPHAFREFLALAKLGQPVAQLDVAIMYRAGQGTEASDIHAYAWASLAAENGEAEGKALAETIRPQLAPGSERIAGWITSAYTPAALSKNLLPDLGRQGPYPPCKLVKWYDTDYPTEARIRRIDGIVLVDFTVMPDGSARFPRIIYALPTGFFESTVRDSVLRSRFGRLPASSPPIECSVPYRFKMSGSLNWDRALNYVTEVKVRATPEDPRAEFSYGLLLGLPQLNKAPGAGMPWFLKAAQGGVPAAQYEIGFCLLTGERCGRDEAKALKWLEMAADGGGPQAEVTLAMRALTDGPGAPDVPAAKGWLSRAVQSGNEDAKLFLAAILAAAPQSELRDPRRALDLLKSIDESDDPATFEIKAAAQASEGDFPRAIRSEQKAIHMARQMTWDLGPLERRLARYQSHNPWYGSLLNFPP